MQLAHKAPVKFIGHIQVPFPLTPELQDPRVQLGQVRLQVDPYILLGQSSQKLPVILGDEQIHVPFPNFPSEQLPEAQPQLIQLFPKNPVAH